MTPSLSFGLSLGGQGGGGVPTLSQLGAENWIARQAVVGNRGTSSAGVLTVTHVGNIGQTWVRVDARPAGSGQWGVAVGQIESDLDEGSLGATAAISSGSITALAADRRFLSIVRAPWAQVFYRPSTGDAWLVASTPKQITLTPQAAIPGVGDWTLEAYSVDPGGNGARIPRVGFLAEASQVFYTTEIDPVNPVEYPNKWTPATVAGDYITLDGLTGGTGATLGPVRIVWRTDQTKISGVSDAKSVSIADLPGAFTSSDVSLVNAQLTTGNGLDLIIVSLPTVDGGTVVRVEYQTSLNGTTYGATTELPAEADTYRITATQRTWVRIRAVSDLGPGPWFVMDATPGIGSVLPTAVSIRVLPAAPVVGQIVHFGLSIATREALAAAAGVSVDDFMATSEFLWEFSVGNAAEDYPFTALPADHMGNTTAGRALGPNAAHVYVETDEGQRTHTVRCTVYRGGTSIGTGTRSLSVPVRTYTTANQGYLATTLPVAGSDGVPSGVTNLFTSVNDAFAWVGGADGRALYIRSGQTFNLTASGTSVRANAFIGPYGSGAKPIINFDPGYRGARIEATGNGTSQTYSGQSLGTSIYVYFGNVLQTEGVGYTRNGNEITATVANGTAIRVFNVQNNGRISIGGSVLQAGGGRDGGIVRGLSFQSQYDPANPGYFSRADLSTANRFANTTCIGGSSGSVKYFTVFDCNINGFGTNWGITNPGEILGAVNCNLDRWANYGFYSSNISRTVTVGCSMVQDRRAQNGTQGKNWNTPIEVSGSVSASLNAPWHGAIRCAYSFEQVLNSCRLDSRTSWSGNEPLRAQPIARLAQSTKLGQNYTFTQCYTSGGQGVFSGGVANQTVTATRLGMAYFGYNVTLGYPGAQSWGNGQIYATSISNIYLAPAGTGATGNFALFRANTSNPIQAANDVRSEPWRSINDTVLILDSRPSNTFEVNPSYVIASAGIVNLYSLVSDFPAGTPKSDRPNRGGYPIPAAAVGTATVRVPINAQSLSAKSTFATRIWRGTSLSNAVTQTTVTERNTVYDIQYHNLNLNDDASTAIRDSEWIEVTLKSGTWSAGETIWVTREQCVETSGSLEIDEDTGEETGNVVTDTPETYHPNNRTTDIVRAPAQLFNTLVLFGGTWGSVIRDGAPITPDTPATYGTWDAYWRPVTGNTAINAAGSIRAAFDVRGQLRSGTSLGALEPDSSVSGWPAIPLVPTVSVALDPDSYSEGDTFGASNVTVTVPTAGAPALLVGDVTKTAEVLDDANAVIGSSSSDLQIGEGVRGRIVWVHPTVPRQETTTTIRRVPDPNFVPVWITSNAALTSPFNGGRVNRSFSAPAAAAQHIAFRMRSRHDEALGGAVRLFVGTGTSPEFNLRLSSAGVLSANIAGTNVATLATIPATDGLISIVVSSYPGDRMEARVKVGDGAVQTVSIPGTPQNLFQTGFRIFSSTQGTPDVDFQQFFGLWTGGAPTWADFFEPNGMVRDWRSNPGLNVTGLTPFVILDGVGTVGVAADTFNGRLDSGALAWSMRTQPTTLQSSITYDGVTVTLAAARPVGFFADGSPFIVSSGAVTINSMSPASDSDGTYDRHGAMLNPDGASGVQGFDGGIGVSADASWVTYSGAANVDPGKTGSPLVIADGGAGTIVKSIRNAAWTAGDWITVDHYVPITVLSSAPPEGAFRPTYAGATKPIVATLDMLDMGVFRSLAPYSGMIAAADAAARISSIWPPFITTSQTEQGYRRMQTLREGASSGYSRDVANYTHAGLLHLHASTATATQKRQIAINAIQRGLDTIGMIEARGPTLTRAGAGQSHGWQSFAYLAAFALRRPSLLETAKTIRGNMTEQHVWNTTENSNNALIEWGTGPQVKNRQVYFPQHMGQPEWRHGDVTIPDNLDRAYDDSLTTATYRATAGNPYVVELMATALLQNGPNGETGAAAVAGGNFTSASRKAAALVYLDRWRAMTNRFTFADSNNSAVYDAWRASLAEVPTWTGIPEQYAPDDLPSLTATDGGFSYDITAATTSSTLPITRYDLRYSLDGISWIEVNNCGTAGTVSGLTRALHYVQFRAVNSAGAGVWSTNFPLDNGITGGFVGTVTPTGTPANSAPAYAVNPVIGWRPYHPWAAPYHEPAPAELAGGVPTLYAGTGYATGHPAPTYTYQWRRNGTPIGGATSQSYTIQGADAGSTLTCAVTATNGSGSAAHTTTGALVAGTPPSAVFYPVAADGGDRLSKTGGLTGVTNNKTGTFAARFRLTGGNATFRTFLVSGIGNRSFEFAVGTNNRLAVTLRNAANTAILFWQSHTSELFTDATGWVTLTCSWNLANASQRHLFINSTATLQAPVTYTDDTINWASTATVGIIGESDGNPTPIIGEFEYVYLSTEYLDLSNATNRNKFTVAADMGVDGSGPTGNVPAIYISGNAAAWNAGLANQGTGGAFTATGTFTDV